MYHELAGNPPEFCGLRRHDDQPDPKDSYLLAALIEAGLEESLNGLEGVPMPQGLVLWEPGCIRPYAYFPTSGIVALSIVLKDGTSTELAITSKEGLVGTSVFMGGRSSQNRATVIAEGYAYRLSAAKLTKEFARNAMLQHLLLYYTAALTAQIAQTAVCNRHHTIDQRLCRLLLMMMDRNSSSEILMTHELFAQLLGVRREGVTEAARHLQAAGLIHYQRGHIAPLDRPRLEQRACECYGVVNREYHRLLPWIPATCCG